MTFKKRDKKSLINVALQAKRSVSDSDRIFNFKVSFQYLDASQRYASSYRDWQTVGLLSKALETLQGYCCRPLMDQVDGDKFTIYGDFPADDKTLYQKPNHVPPDAKWARIHITGPAVIVGHVLGDTFYVVFLDKTHKFYLTKKFLENRN